jgi:hypothetical protein
MAKESTHYHNREQTSFGASIVDRLRHGWRARPQGCGLSTMQAPKEVCVFGDKMLRLKQTAPLPDGRDSDPCSNEFCDRD